MLIDAYQFGAFAWIYFVSLFAANYILLFRKITKNFFDPLNIVYNATLSGSGAIYIYLVTSGESLTSFVYWFPFLYFVSIITLWYFSEIIPWIKLELFRFGVSFNSILGLYAVILLIYYMKFGIVLFQDSPLDSKLMYGEGSGLYKKFLSAATDLLIVGSVVSYAKYAKKIYLFFGVVAVIATSLFVVSKSSVLSGVLIMLFFLLIHGKWKAFKALLLLMPIGIAFALTAIYLTLLSGSQSAGFFQIMYVLLIRIMAYGDASFYVLLNQSVIDHFEQKNYFDLIFGSLSPALAGLRIISWDSVRSVGGEIYALMVGSYTGVGPNAFNIVEAYLFLGGWLGAVHVAFVSFLVILLRKIFLNMLSSFSIARAYTSYFVIHYASSFLIDSSFVGSMVIDMAIVGFLIFIAYVLTWPFKILAGPCCALHGR